MPDPLTVKVNEKTLADESLNDKIVRAALRRRMARKRKAAPKSAAETYDKLAMLVPSVSKVLNNASYGPDAGGFKPPVRTDSGNGTSDSKVGKPKMAYDSWVGINKLAFLGEAGVGALGGLGAGALYGGLFPGEDEEGKQKSRLAAAAKYGLLGGGIGGAGGAGYAALAPLIAQLSSQQAPDQLAGLDTPLPVERQTPPTPAGVPSRMPDPLG